MSKKNQAPKSETPKSAGRPQFKLKYPQSTFTVNSLFAKNSVEAGGKVKSGLCIRQHIDRGLTSGLIVWLDRLENDGQAGRPNYVFALTDVATRHGWTDILDHTDPKVSPTKAEKVKPVKAVKAPKTPKAKKAKKAKKVKAPKTETVPVTEVPAAPVAETPAPVVEVTVAPVMETPAVVTETAPAVS
jgi:hypothetical protein